MKLNKIEREILNQLKNDKFSDLNNLIKSRFICINNDRNYLAIEVKDDKYIEEANGQAFIFTVEGDEDYEKYDEEDMGFNQYIAWNGEEGFLYGMDLKSALEHVQRIALNIHTQY